ncbi:GntR family transcriptional regulator [Enterococcus faecium]|nr:GntR family transcriptional regulator [Enterococcus faecium]MCC9085561.1 GntR family transcriptional regulator [Enterococcus faecium]
MNTEELTNKLIQDIEQEKYKYAQAIPSERDFVQIYEMNRSAVKKPFNN